MGSYGWNLWVTRGTGIPPEDEMSSGIFHNDSAISNPALTPIFSECATWGAHPLETHGPSKDLYSLDLAQGSVMAFYTMARHGGRGTAHGSLPVDTSKPLGPY